MMPADGIDTLRGFDAIFLGAVGWPAQVPDSVSLHGLLLPIRKAFVQYANIRPHRLLPGVEGPLRSERLRHPLHPREHRRRIFRRRRPRACRHPDEVAVETSIFTRQGRRAHPALRLRAGAAAARQARLGDEIERPEALDGVLGRDHRPGRRRLSGRRGHAATISTRCAPAW